MAKSRPVLREPHRIHPRITGHSGELYFASEAMVKGVLLFDPLGDYLPYDFLAGGSGGYRKIQVKTARRDRQGRYQVLINRVGRPYAGGDFDFYALCAPQAGAIYIVPQGAADKLPDSFRIFPDGGPLHPRAVDHVGEWRDRWDLLL